jgi:hypothetical protein
VGVDLKGKAGARADAPDQAVDRIRREQAAAERGRAVSPSTTIIQMRRTRRYCVGYTKAMMTRNRDPNWAAVPLPVKLRNRNLNCIFRINKCRRSKTYQGVRYGVIAVQLHKL